jgi:hypothetical protein
MGQRSMAAGFSWTRPLSTAESSNGRSVPQTLGPPRADLLLMNVVRASTPDDRHAFSSFSRQGSYLATKSGPELQPENSAVARTGKARTRLKRMTSERYTD